MKLVRAELTSGVASRVFLSFILYHIWFFW